MDCYLNVVAYSAFLDGVCKTGDFNKALELLDEMENEDKDLAPDVITYTSVIQSFCEQSRASEALHSEQMGSQGCPANRIIVSTLIKGLCNEGLVDEAYQLIDKVVADGSVTLEGVTVIYFWLYCISKNMEEAVKLFKQILESGIRPGGLASIFFIKQLCLQEQFLRHWTGTVRCKRKIYSTRVDSHVDAKERCKRKISQKGGGSCKCS